MFSFFKKKEKTTSKEVVEPLLSEEDKTEIQNNIAAEESLLETLHSEEDLAVSYEKIGIWKSELNDVDGAIKALETSLDKKLSMGDGYKKLMSLYNQKRAQAAKERDNEGIDYYMSKMDDMRNIAKKLTLSR
ncbi:tetratricopeptide repeat protein [Streptococcus cameli]